MRLGSEVVLNPENCETSRQPPAPRGTCLTRCTHQNFTISFKIMRRWWSCTQLLSFGFLFGDWEPVHRVLSHSNPAVHRCSPPECGRGGSPEALGWAGQGNGAAGRGPASGSEPPPGSPSGQKPSPCRTGNPLSILGGPGCGPDS